MEPTTHIIDPSGDTLLILKNANAPFAVVPLFVTLQTQQDESDSAAADQPWIPKSKPEVRMRLSSKHLALASAYFKKLTTSGCKETIPQNGYSYVITAQDWDEGALLVLMNIIHGRTAKVPREVNLEMLAKISVLVDYYQCHEAVQFFAETWIRHQETSFYFTHRRDLLLRLIVSWVFSEDSTFWSLTGDIIYESKEPVNSLGLPIPQAIIDALNKRREDLISMILSGLHNLKTQLYENDGGCSYECSAIHLGALIKGMSKMRILDPAPERPFLGHSFSELKKDIRAIKEPSWNSTCPRPLAAPETTTSGLFSSSPKPAAPPPKAGGLFSNLPSSSGGLFSASPAFNPCSVSARTKSIMDKPYISINGFFLTDFDKNKIGDSLSQALLS